MRHSSALKALLLLFLATVVQATTVKPMSVQDLTEASSNVVRARALDAHSEWDATRTLIYTYTRFQSLSTLKGQPSNEFVVRQLGGHADGYTQKVSGVRHWQPGEEVVLFLRPSQTNGVYAVTGLFQGNFSVQRAGSGEATVSNGVVGVSTLQGGKVSAYRGAQLTLRQLEQSVERSSGGPR